MRAFEVTADLLPPNATNAERALSLAVARAANVPTIVRTTWNPATCPPALLPWLAWAFSVDEWSDAWTVEEKRAAIVASHFVHRHKGTIGAVRASLAALGLNSQVLEWFQEEPPAEPYTFAIDFEVTNKGLDPQIYYDAERLALASKNARSHLSRIRAVARSNGAVHIGVGAASGEAVSVMPYRIEKIVVSAPSYYAAALLDSETVTVFPGAAEA